MKKKLRQAVTGDTIRYYEQDWGVLDLLLPQEGYLNIGVVLVGAWQSGDAVVKARVRRWVRAYPPLLSALVKNGHTGFRPGSLFDQCRTDCGLEAEQIGTSEYRRLTGKKL